MELRPLGSTGVEVSPIGFGAFKIGRNRKTKYADPYELPTDEEVDALLAGALDAGINLIDTAPAYGTSEARVGRFLAESGRRDAVVLASKVGEHFQDGVSHYAFDRASVTRSLDSSLHALGTDRIDIVCVHSDGEDLAIIRESDVLEVLAERRDAGDVGLVGFSGKTVEGHLACLDPSMGVAVLMVELNPHQRAQEEVLHAASAAGIGILVKKGLGSGDLDPTEALPWILRHPEISSIVIGGLSLEHVHSNVAIALEALRT